MNDPSGKEDTISFSFQEQDRSGFGSADLFDTAETGGNTMLEMFEVDGENRGDITLYALSTCVWCRRTKKLLGDLGVSFRYIFVDMLDQAGRKEAESEIMRWNPRCSFPTLVIDNEKCIVGFQEDRIKEALEHA